MGLIVLLQNISQTRLLNFSVETPLCKSPWSLPQLFATQSVTELVNRTLAGVLTLAGTREVLVSPGRFFFLLRFAQPNEMDAETGTAQVLSIGQRMEKQEFSLQINFSTQFRWRCQIYDSQGNREGIGKSERNIHDLSETWIQLGHRTDSALLLGSVWVVLAVGMATVNCYGAGGCVIQHANELK